jgi:hypothetical protein
MPVSQEALELSPQYRKLKAGVIRLHKRSETRKDFNGGRPFILMAVRRFSYKLLKDTIKGRRYY